MQKKWRKLLPTALLFVLGCGSGELPTAVEQPQQLYASYIRNEQDIPVLDGRGDDKIWQTAPVYRVFLDNKNGGVGLPGGMLVELQAAWWRVIIDTTHVGPSRIDTTFATYVGFRATWPDDDKSIASRPWNYNPADSTWSQGAQGTDWLLLVWQSFTDDTDLWYWDAATTNPMGYFQDMVFEGFDTGKGIEPLFVRVDGLNFFNDTPTAQNTWDPNYDNNNTPNNLRDDRPKFAWKNDPATTPPALPPVYSSTEENRQFLLIGEAVSLATSAYAKPRTAVTVPSAVLQEPLGGSADIPAFGRHENGKWTLEFARIAKASDNNDVLFNPATRFFSQTFSMAVGNNVTGAFDGDLAKLTIQNSTTLTFEFRR